MTMLHDISDYIVGMIVCVKVDQSNCMEGT